MQREKKTHLLINGIKFPIECTHVLETCPPYECYDIKANGESKGIAWKPSTDPTTIPKTFQWTSTLSDEKSIPELLITTQGSAVSCQVISEDGKVICNYGDQVYLLRGGGGCSGGHNSQDITPGHYYVGQVVKGVGGTCTSVVFKYADGILIPLSCEFQRKWSQRVIFLH